MAKKKPVDAHVQPVIAPIAGVPEIAGLGIGDRILILESCAGTQFAYDFDQVVVVNHENKSRLESLLLGGVAIFEGDKKKDLRH